MALTMTIRQLVKHRARFQLAPGAASDRAELPLIEKQALVDEILRGMPIKQIEYVEQVGDTGKKTYLVTKGWAQINAILDFTDGKFPTWTDADKRRWERSRSLN